MITQRIVLASLSPRRKQLLEWAEVKFDIVARPGEEKFPDNLPLADVPVYIARQKALTTRQSDTYIRYETNPVILAADTIVVLDDHIIGKPADREDAIRILLHLSGKKHRVITGVVITDGKREVAFADQTDVWFHELTPEQIGYYVDQYKPYDKAGAYAIQEWIGVVGIKSIQGDFYNVMGLPVSRVIQELEKFN